MPVRTDIDPWVLFIAVTALLIALWTSHAVKSAYDNRVTPPWGLLVVGALGAGITGAVMGLNAVLPPFMLFIGVSGGIWLTARHLSTPGVAWMTVDFLGIAIAWLWGCLFIRELSLPFEVQLVALLGVSITLAVSILGAMERIAREAIFTHDRWRLPFTAPAAPRLSVGDQPKVSIQLPCYAEPPEVVKETMNRLAALDYHNFEVLVCDNNTKDEALWRPLESHAELLNRRMGREVFRFFHVSPLPGAKAGALNWLLDYMAQDAEIIAVIDADYYSKPDFLSRLVPFFANPSVAYLQTPHDYRDFEASRYLSACYSEYMPNNKIDMLGVHEYGGAFTIGTMCLLRTDVLRRVGGWAEWCLTEDSEISVRMRAAGFRGMYLGETFGRGLIPDTFDDYKKQRFRWTAGPVQQLVRHWRMFLPSPWARRMPGWTKMLEVLRCIAPLRTLAGVVIGLVGLASIAVTNVTGAGAPIDVPDIAWSLIPLALLTTLVRTWHRYRIAGIMQVRDMVRGEVARAALTWVVLVAGVAGLSNKPLAWRRTPKFGGTDSFAGALYSAMPEMLLGLVTTAAAVGMYLLHPSIGVEMTIIACSSLGFLALRFFCAPYMAVLARRDAMPQTVLPANPGPNTAELAA